MNYVKEELVYLSCPYSDLDHAKKDLRHKVASEVAYELHQEGYLTFSPLTHNVPLDRISGADNANWVTWKRFNHELLSRCNRLMVIQLPGWETSEGVQAEIVLAKKLQLPISYIPCPKETLRKWEEAICASHV